MTQPAVRQQHAIAPLALFSMSGVSVHFGGVVALSDVAVDVRPGEVLGIIGPNGAGKTTLFNVACGFVAPDQGLLSWDGRTLPQLRPRDLAGLGIARTLQGLGLFDGMSVLENVMVGADRHARAGFWSGLLALPASGKDERALRERARDALAELGIAQHADRLPSSLPYPTRKRVALARALVSEPRLLLLDEPASGLSDTEMSEMGDLIREVTSRTAVMLVEHHMDLVMRVCDRITVLDFGRVIAQGAPAQVREQPAVLAAYLGEDVDHPPAPGGDPGREKGERRA